jgi:two-component system, OmpR family, clock-associated histidine kinase SasA
MFPSDLPSELNQGLEAPLQLVLFIDHRAGVEEQVQRIRAHLQQLTSEFSFDLKIVDVSEQPYLAEHFRLIATPALIKMSPEPRQTLAGRKLLEQLDSWWPRWQQQVRDVQAEQANPSAETDPPPSPSPSLSSAAELLRMDDQLFDLTRDNEALRDQLQFKDRIIAMLAHDLRNPLTAASIALETLEGQWNREEQDPGIPKLDEAMLQRLTLHARSQIQVIERMITNLLLAARGKSAELEIQPRRLDLKALFSQVVEDLNPTFSQKQQRVNTDIPADLPLVLADADRVRQVLINLLENASKYTPKQGLIEVSMLHRTTQKVQVSVCDNGLGIPPDKQERIFEDEFRLKRDEHLEGYGLGLALCRRIIRAHYGHIWVDSIPGEGSCFHFTLPVHIG